MLVLVPATLLQQTSFCWVPKQSIGLPLGWIWPGFSSPLCICQCAMATQRLSKKIRLVDLIGYDCCQVLTDQQLIVPNSTHFTSMPPLCLGCIGTSGHEICKYLFVTDKWAWPVSSTRGFVRQHETWRTSNHKNKQAPSVTLAAGKEYQRQCQQLLIGPFIW